MLESTGVNLQEGCSRQALRNQVSVHDQVTLSLMSPDFRDSKRNRQSSTLLGPGFPTVIFFAVLYQCRVAG